MENLLASPCCVPERADPIQDTVHHCHTYELSQQNGICSLGKESVEKWDASLALTVPRIPKTFQRRFYVGPRSSLV